MSEPVTKEDLDWLRAYAKCEVMDLFCSQPMPPYYRVRLLRLLDERYAAVARLGEVEKALRTVLKNAKEAFAEADTYYDHWAEGNVEAEAVLSRGEAADGKA